MSSMSPDEPAARLTGRGPGLRLTFTDPRLDNLYVAHKVIEATADFMATVSLAEAVEAALGDLRARGMQIGSLDEQTPINEALRPVFRLALAIRLVEDRELPEREILRVGLSDDSQEMSTILEMARHSVSPHVQRLTMNSPLVMELIGIAPTVVYLLKHPKDIGSWIPKVRAGWYEGEIEREKVRRDYEFMEQAGLQIEELERSDAGGEA